jgi:hypothetical protein
MHEVVNALIIAAVVVLVLLRRFTPRRLDGRRSYTLPAVVAVVALTQGTGLDSRHVALSAGLLAAEMVLAVLLGLGLGATMRVWRAPDGAAWSRGTWAALGVFVAAVAVRAGLFAAGAAAGVRPGGTAILLSVAAWLAAQHAMLAWRVRALPAGVTVGP